MLAMIFSHTIRRKESDAIFLMASDASRRNDCVENGDGKHHLLNGAPTPAIRAG